MSKRIRKGSAAMQNANDSHLPHDLLEFLRAGCQLEYDARKVELGRIKLKRASDLTPTTITTFPGCQSIIDDPYRVLDGLYQCEVYDLVEECEVYDTEGLLCWIVALERFGCIDPEHGDVITYADVTWTNIAQDPVPYLTAQWGDEYDVAERVLPWLHFPFRLRETNRLLTPYGSQCPVHEVPVTVQKTSKPPLFDLLRRRGIESWLESYQAVFPCSGVPVSDEELLCCGECRTAEDAWMQQIDASILPLDATPNAHGWVQCPGCGTRFSTSDAGNFADGVHLACGQKVNLVC